MNIAEKLAREVIGAFHEGDIERIGTLVTEDFVDHGAPPWAPQGRLTEAEAADLLWALTAPELVDRLVRRRGWTVDRYEQWLAGAMADALVGPG